MDLIYTIKTCTCGKGAGQDCTCTDIRMGVIEDKTKINPVLILLDGLEAIAECTEEDYQQIAKETLEAYYDVVDESL